MSSRSSVLAGLVAFTACARVDVRELLPAQSLSTHRPRVVAARVVVAPSLLGRLSGPPSLSGGLGTLVPEPLGDTVAAFPVLGGLVGGDERAAWQEEARRLDVLTPRLVEAVLSGPGVPLTAARPWWALSDDAAAMAAARAQGAELLLTVHASVGPEDSGTPLPGRITAAADVSLLDPWAGETVARAYDRVSVPVRGGRDALPSTLKRAGTLLGQRIRGQLGMGQGEVSPRDDDEDDEPVRR